MMAPVGPGCGLQQLSGAGGGGAGAAHNPPQSSVTPLHEAGAAPPGPPDSRCERSCPLRLAQPPRLRQGPEVYEGEHVYNMYTHIKSILQRKLRYVKNNNNL
jgi:hypothetical protein